MLPLQRYADDRALVGHFGNLPPAIAVVGDDPDDGDASYGASDVLTVTFDMATNRSRAIRLAASAG